MNNKDSLSAKKCVPCSAGTPRLRGKEVTQLLDQLTEGWKLVEERHIEKEYLFPNFKSALQFVNDIGAIAEKQGHHPDIFLAWGKVKVLLWTHKIHGLSENDFVLAAKCDEQYNTEGGIKDF